MNETDKSNLVDGLYSIRDLVDIDRLRRILERFSKVTGFTIGFLDHPEMNILIATGWRDICTVFHREHSVAMSNCLKSNWQLLGELDDPKKIVIEECDNGLVDCAVPVIIAGKHIASLVTGQLFLEEPDIKFFQRQAAAFGFNEKEYLQAVRSVPVVSRDDLRDVTAFLGEIAQIISEQGYTNLRIKKEALHLESEITQRKLIEEGLRQSEEKYRFLAENLADIIWTLDLGLHTTYVSPSVEKVLGFTPEERKKLTPEQMLTPDSLQILRKVLAENAGSEMSGAFSNNQSVIVELEQYCRDGSTKWIESSVKLMLDSSGEIVGIYGVSRDISLQREAEAEKGKLKDRLVVAQKMESLGRLAGGVAHDFNNLLTVILGHTELALQKLTPSDKLYDSFVQIRHAAQDSASLTRQLLAFARKQVVKPKILDINEAVSSMLKMLRRLIGERIELTWKPGPDLCTAKIDPGQIDQILVNLCINARDAVTGDGRIDIETENVSIDMSYCIDHPGIVPGDYVMLTVRDNGHGIDKDLLGHIFEPFFTTKGVGQGTGLGLATVYGIVKQNGGYVDVWSELNQGSAIHIYLPGSLTEVVESQNNSNVEMPLGHGETVLLVEDEMAVLKMTQAMLEDLGYEVISANLPGEALHLIQGFKREIHLLLTDMVMPEMNGRELAEQIRRIRPSMKYLFMSGYTANVSTSPDLFAEGIQFIQKPFSMLNLAMKVRKALDL